MRRRTPSPPDRPLRLASLFADRQSLILRSPSLLFAQSFPVPQNREFSSEDAESARFSEGGYSKFLSKIHDFPCRFPVNSRNHHGGGSITAGTRSTSPSWIAIPLLGATCRSRVGTEIPVTAAKRRFSRLIPPK